MEAIVDMIEDTSPTYLLFFLCLSILWVVVIYECFVKSAFLAVFTTTGSVIHTRDTHGPTPHSDVRDQEVSQRTWQVRNLG